MHPSSYPEEEVRFKDYGVKSFEVIDNGTGIAPEDYGSIGSFSKLHDILLLNFKMRSFETSYLETRFF